MGCQSPSMVKELSFTGFPQFGQGISLPKEDFGIFRPAQAVWTTKRY